MQSTKKRKKSPLDNQLASSSDNAHPRDVVEEQPAPESLHDGKKTRARPDRAAKKRKRIEESETVVKACLLKHIQGGRGNKDIVRQALRARVASYSRRIHAASLGLTHLVKQLFDGVQDINTMMSTHVPEEFFDQTFIRQLMLGTSGAQAPHQRISSLHQEFPEYLVTTDRHAGDRNIYSAGAIKYVTNLKNHMVMNLERFTKRAIYALFPNATGRQRWETLRGIMGTSGEKVEEVDGDENDANTLPEEMTSTIDIHRRVLGLVNATDRVGPGWLKSKRYLPLILRYFVFLNNTIEREGARQTTPRDRQRILKNLFDVVPICKIREHFITVDTSVLYGLMMELKYISSDAHGAFGELRDAHWRSLLHISRLQGKDMMFTGTVDTDGTSICVHFVRKKIVSSDTPDGSGEQFMIQEDDFVIGNDPGLKDIASLAIPKKAEDGAKVLNQKDMNRKVLSRGRYYQDSGMIAARRHTQKWNNTVRSSLDALSTVSTKGASLATFQEFMAVYNIYKGDLWGEYTKPRWARQRFRLYGGKKRVFATFLNEVEKMIPTTSKRIVIAYGAGRAVAMKGSTPAPSTRAYNEFRNRFITIPVDEFRTTYTHHERDCVLKKVAKQRRRRTTIQKICYGDEPNRHREENTRIIVRGLLWCDSTSSNANKHFVNRDFNAAINIRRCLILPDRPSSLKRSTFKGRPLVHQVGMTIKR